MGRKCAVPHCYTGYRKCKEKASLYRVPDDDFFLSKWQEAIAREDRPITPRDYVCEKHFKDDDILRKRIIKDVAEEYQRPRLKPDAIPSIFPDLPEFILKMVKKRRKIALEDSEGVEENENVEKEIKFEPLESDLTENLTNPTCETFLNNEVDIKSEPEEYSDHSTETEEDNETNDPDFGPKMHKCDQCDYQTKYAHNLRTHKTKHLTGEDAYMHCEYCPKFKTKWELTYRNHLKIKHGIGKREIFKCGLCSFETKVKICLKRHFERHQLDVTFIQCDFLGCAYKTEHKRKLALHKLSHNLDTNSNNNTAENTKNFKCTECLYATNSKTHIIRHIKTTHNAGDDTVVSVNIQKKQKSINNSNVKEKSLYKCLKCSYKSKTRNCLLRHIFKHKYPKAVDDGAKTNVWKCPKCPFATFFRNALQRHQEMNCGDLFLCKECNFKSNDKPDFIKHSLTHRNVTVESVSQDVYINGKAKVWGTNSKQICNEGTNSSTTTRLEETVIDESFRNDTIPEFITVKSETSNDLE